MGEGDKGDQTGSWGEIGVVCATDQLRFSASRSGAALSIIFDNLQIDLRGTAAPLVSQVSFTCQIPFDLPRRRGLYGFFGSLRGAVLKSDNARAILLVAVGNATKALNFPYGQGTVEAASRDLATGVDSLFSIEGWLSDAESGGAIMPRPPLIVSLGLLAQRQTQNDDLLLQIDSLDLQAISYDGGKAGSG